MKEESVLNIIMYLFKHELFDEFEINNAKPSLVNQLEKAGFDRQMISRALQWIANLEKQANTPISLTSQNAIRVYSKEECSFLSKECRGFIHFLEQSDILKPYTREMVLTQLSALQKERIDIHLIKWVTMLVLFTQRNEKKALDFMEFLVLNEQVGSIH
jgi:Smg protein